MSPIVGRAHRRNEPNRHLYRTVPVVLAAAAVALLSTACTGGEPEARAVARVTSDAATGGGDTAGGNGGAAQSSGSGDIVAYANCMRHNGIPNFPDPKPGGGIAFPEGGDIDPQSPEFKKAEEKCKQYLPSGPRIDAKNDADPNAGWPTADKLKYAQCMRENGLPKFPDPDKNGGFAFMQDSGIDPQSPQFRKASEACAKYQPQNLRQQPGPGGPGGPAVQGGAGS
ncbi:hypothetical protein AB0C10_36715 [Microbispora amethystogenes]|uniref:Uncharacterized protein n=2 Tax=Microbispora TaxID=2005 RepID=A0A5J5JWM3_9ACTN|nr:MULTISPECIES: hypothetical protein [Microbispora]KAA9374763.1 hypothetical protein F5972_29575 [Microbispora cellulosiformans]GIH36753.1 hypothetical protein Mam01_69170 [Microbispora amethystogenes]